MATCAGGTPEVRTDPEVTTKAMTPPGPAPRGMLVGTVTRKQIEAAVPAWRAAEADAAPEAVAVKALGRVPPGAAVEVYLGTWCGDSRRELTRLWRALDQMGKKPPFPIRYVAVDRGKQAPGLSADLGLRRVPTFIVTRGGQEVGRIVESAPDGIEADLGALLLGTRSGVISERTDDDH